MGDKLLDQIFNLKFTSKQLVKQSHKCEKDEKAEKLKVKKAIEKGNIDGAKIYAQVSVQIGQAYRLLGILCESALSALGLLATRS